MTPFPRTMRSLNANRARPWLIAWGSAMLVLLAWIGWFVFASITFNEVSENVQVVKSNIVMARFNSESIKRIKKGIRPKFPVGITLNYQKTFILWLTS